MSRRASRLSREQVTRELAALYRELGRPLRARDIPNRLRLGVRLHFRTFDRARLAAGIPAPPRWKRWNLAIVLRRLRAVFRSGVIVTCRGLIDNAHHDLVAAIYHYVGSMPRARVLARVPHPPCRQREKEPWDEDRVVAEILDHHERGRSVASSKVDPRLVAAARRHFGSWQTAIEASGLDYATIRLRHEDYTREDILAHMRALAARSPDMMSLSEANRVSCIHAVLRVFGSVESAARATGLRGWPRRFAFPVMTRRQVIARLRARKRAGKSIYSRAVVNADPRLWRSAISHYAHWRTALAAARLTSDSPQQRVWSRQLVLERLRERQRAGESLRPTDVQRTDGSLYTQAGRYFGSYRLAAKRLGVETSKRHWTKPMVLGELRRAAGKNRRLTAAQTPATVVVAAQKLFGAFSKACGSAGLEVHTKRKWTRADTLRELRRLALTGPVDSRRATGGLDHACRRFFGSFVAARRAALGDAIA